MIDYDGTSYDDLLCSGFLRRTLRSDALGKTQNKPNQTELKQTNQQTKCEIQGSITRATYSGQSYTQWTQQVFSR